MVGSNDTMIATPVASDCKSCKCKRVITLVESLKSGWMNVIVCKAVLVMILSLKQEMKATAQQLYTV